MPHPFIHDTLVLMAPRVHALPYQLPVDLRLGLLQEAQERDLVTARRAALLGLIWHESFLSATGLMARTEAVVGRGCFGKAAAATLKRDLRALKSVLASNGFALRFSRRAGRRGYFIPGRFSALQILFG